MWVAKIKTNNADTIIGTEAAKYDIDLFGFPLSYEYQDDCTVLQLAGTMLGDDKNKQKFINALQKKEEILNFETTDSFLIGTIKGPEVSRAWFNKDIFHIAPIFISREGYEIFTVGSFQRENLTNIAEKLKKMRKGQLMSIHKKNITSISIAKISPPLTDKQKRAMELALKHGYYRTPRNIDVVGLARIAEVGFGTFHQHLRKAEEKLIPFYYE